MGWSTHGPVQEDGQYSNPKLWAVTRVNVGKHFAQLASQVTTSVSPGNDTSFHGCRSGLSTLLILGQGCTSSRRQRHSLEARRKGGWQEEQRLQRVTDIFIDGRELRRQQDCAHLTTKLRHRFLRCVFSPSCKLFLFYQWSPRRGTLQKWFSRFTCCSRPDTFGTSISYYFLTGSSQLSFPTFQLPALVVFFASHHTQYVEPSS